VKPKRLTNKQRARIRREVDLELGIESPRSGVYISKKQYKRKEKHKKDVWNNEL